MKKIKEAIATGNLTLLIGAIVLFNLKWNMIHGIFWVPVIVLIAGMVLAKSPGQCSHVLNNIFRLPHPYEDDEQGACGCHRGQKRPA